MVRKRFRGSIRERFEWYAIPEPNSGCTIWTGGTDKDGYGLLDCGKKQTKRAHRLAWILNFGPIPNGLHVLHKCDNPSCVKADPDPHKSHLFLGTNRDNILDSIKKNRWPQLKYIGSEHPCARFTEDEVRIIREDPRTNAEIANDFGVAPETIGVIKLGITWKHAPGPIQRKRTYHKRHKFTDDEIRLIKKDERPYKEIARMFGITYAIVSQIKTGRIWKHVK